MDDQTLARVRAELANVKVPSSYSKVFKDECVYSFANAESDGGIFINMNTWQGVGAKYLTLDHERTGNVLYFNEKHFRVPNQDVEMDTKSELPTKMMIGGDEGFQVDKKKYSIDRETAVVIMPEKIQIQLPCPELPELVLSAIAGIEVCRSWHRCQLSASVLQYTSAGPLWPWVQCVAKLTSENVVTSQC